MLVERWAEKDLNLRPSLFVLHSKLGFVNRRLSNSPLNSAEMTAPCGKQVDQRIST
jgi:hypothetical protein